MREVRGWARAHFVTAQIAASAAAGAIWEEEQMLGYLIGAFSKIEHGRD